MGTGNKNLYGNTKGSLIPEHLLEELRNSGEKYTSENVLMLTKTQKGELVWLEKGNNIAGLIHIVNRHGTDLKRKFGVKEESISSFIKEVLTFGQEISSKAKNNGYEKEYKYQDEHTIVVAIGKNGFIVTIYPKS